MTSGASGASKVGALRFIVQTFLFLPFELVPAPVPLIVFSTNTN